MEGLNLGQLVGSMVFSLINLFGCLQSGFSLIWFNLIYSDRQSKLWNNQSQYRVWGYDIIDGLVSMKSQLWLQGATGSDRFVVAALGSSAALLHQH